MNSRLVPFDVDEEMLNQQTQSPTLLDTFSSFNKTSYYVVFAYWYSMHGTQAFFVHC